MKILKIFLPVLLLSSLAVLPAWAACTSSGASQTENDRTALIPFGNVNLFDTHFSPVGTLLGSVTVPPTNYTFGGATASTVLWTCDQSDLSSIYFLVATNGDDRVGGFYDLGPTDGLTDIYATYFAYVGLKLTMDSQVLTRYWQKVPVTSYATSGTKIQIRLQDVPPLNAELYRISSLPGTSSVSSYCGNNNTTGSGIIYGTTSGSLYSCTQPNAYIQLKGPGLVADEVGEDSAYHWDFWAYDNGFGYGMRAVNRLYNTPTCVVRSATPLVLLPTITVNDLNNGLSSSANFTVSVECSNSVNSGTATSQTALGFQVSPGAYSAASSLGLVNSSSGVSMLLSDNYFSGTSAQGVGITIAYANAPSTPLTLIGQNGIDPINSSFMGSSAGWYPVLNNASATGSSASGYTNYSYNFVAALKKISGQTVTAGKVRATATVVVKVQ
ncbi:fimbrial protein [Candidatus Erwinia dacicola]|uniref:Adhesin n=1 Tax=Candidatus Erwinia dacicola TaxID=252393 RepID=A0A1E7Z3N8_9GAMM|nr:fimbrial protein [Candidatus Erwinia dacicola]OFC63218.1 adhesin [Candidatus Erwinia dacicola]RAP71767.1 fimbrial family protein [Candidatus Erwinia dacicola]